MGGTTSSAPEQEKHASPFYRVKVKLMKDGKQYSDVVVVKLDREGGMMTDDLLDMMFDMGMSYNYKKTGIYYKGLLTETHNQLFTDGDTLEVKLEPGAPDSALEAYRRKLFALPTFRWAYAGGRAAQRPRKRKTPRQSQSRGSRSRRRSKSRTSSRKHRRN